MVRSQGEKNLPLREPEAAGGKILGKSRRFESLGDALIPAALHGDHEATQTDQNQHHGRRFRNLTRT